MISSTCRAKKSVNKYHKFGVVSAISTYGQALDGARLLDVGEGGVKVLELSINLLNGALGLGDLVE